MMSLKTIPGSGKSGTSRILAFNPRLHWLVPCEVPQVAPEEQLRELLGELCERLELLHGRLSPLRVPRAERRRDELLEQACLPVGRRPERAQVPGRDAETGELRAGDGDVHVAGRVALVAAVASRLQQPVLLELARQLVRDRRRARRARSGRARRPGRPGRRPDGGGAPCPLPTATRAPGGSRAAAGTRRAGGAGSSPAARRRPR